MPVDRTFEEAPRRRLIPLGRERFLETTMLTPMLKRLEAQCVVARTRGNSDEHQMMRVSRGAPFSIA